MDLLPALDSLPRLGGSAHAIGDPVLIRPKDPEDRTDTGLDLPVGVQSKGRVQGGRIVKTGPGHLVANPDVSDAEPRARQEAVRYLPLQARTGDHALPLREEATELEYGGTSYRIVPHAALLALVRPQPPEDAPDFGSRSRQLVPGTRPERAPVNPPDLPDEPRNA